jgi:hypothetical protein
MNMENVKTTEEGKMAVTVQHEQNCMEELGLGNRQPTCSVIARYSSLFNPMSAISGGY